jgi:hypothetical protein
MDTYSIREAAAILGTFVPSIQRAVDCPGLRLDPGTMAGGSITIKWNNSVDASVRHRLNRG